MVECGEDGDVGVLIFPLGKASRLGAQSAGCEFEKVLDPLRISE